MFRRADAHDKTTQLICLSYRAHAIRVNKQDIFGHRANLIWGPRRGCGVLSITHRPALQTLAMWTKKGNRLVTCGTLLCIQCKG